MKRRVTVLIIACIALAAAATPASAYWPGSGSGSGLGATAILSSGNQPSGTSSLTTVTVQWPQTDFQGSWLGSYSGGGYVILRYPAGGGSAITPTGTCGTLVGGAAAILSCQDTGVPPGDWKYTTASTLNSWTGAESALSATVAVAPNAPVFSSATAGNPAAGDTTGDISLVWQAVPAANGYDVFRRPTSGSFDFNAPINGATPLTGTSYTDSGAALVGGTTYAYVVRARADSASSPSSNELTATAIARPAAPSGPGASAIPSAQVSVSWSSVADATGYNVYRRTPPGAYNYASPLNGATLVAATSYTDTTAVHGGTYQYVVRAAKPGAGAVTIESFSSVETPAVTADGTVPTAVSMSDPGTPLAGSITLNGSATDTGSGIATMRFQYTTSGGSTWYDACVDATSPYSCAFDTATATDGIYDLRVLATDGAGNATASSTIASRRIDNTAPSATMNDPGQYLRLSVTLGASSADGGSGLPSLVIQRAPTGTSTWTTICSSATSPASCSWNTTLVADGGYDLRAVATDAAGNIGTSALVTNRVVDNTAPAGVDIQTVNGGVSAGKPDTGDQIVYTFSETVLASTVLAGWTGASTGVTVRFTNANPDVVTVWNAANTAQTAIGSVRIGKKYVPATMAFTGSTMVLGGSTITVTLGTPSGATSQSAAAVAIQWITSSAVTDPAGNPLTAGTIAESGAVDADF